MKAATDSKRFYEQTKLLSLNKHSIVHSQVGQLKDFLQPGSVLVINRSATLPSSFRGQIERSGEPIEIRLVGSAARAAFSTRIQPLASIPAAFSM